MKKWRLIVTGSVLMAMMTVFTACGTGNTGNAADETAMKDETKKEDAVEGDLIDKEDAKDNDDFVNEIMDNGAGSGNTNMGNNANTTNGSTAGEKKDADNEKEKSNHASGSQNSAGGTMNENDEDSVTGALGDSARSLGKGIGNAIEDIGDAFDGLSKDR